MNQSRLGYLRFPSFGSCSQWLLVIFRTFSLIGHCNYFQLALNQKALCLIVHCSECYLFGDLRFFVYMCLIMCVMCGGIYILLAVKFERKHTAWETEGEFPFIRSGQSERTGGRPV